MKQALAAPLLLLLFCPGCAAWIASRDADAAIQAAAETNLANVETAAADKLAVHADGLDEIVEILLDALAKAADGKAALIVYQQYKAKQAELTAARRADAAQYANALDNAHLLLELIGRKRAISSGWDRMLGRIPGMDVVWAKAEKETRLYMDKLHEGRP